MKSGSANKLILLSVSYLIYLIQCVSSNQCDAAVIVYRNVLFSFGWYLTSILRLVEIYEFKVLRVPPEKDRSSMRQVKRRKFGDILKVQHILQESRSG